MRQSPKTLFFCQFFIECEYVNFEIATLAAIRYLNRSFSVLKILLYLFQRIPVLFYPLLPSWGFSFFLLLLLHGSNFIKKTKREKTSGTRVMIGNEVQE